MRIHRFFIEQKLPNSGTVKFQNDELVHQWRNVLRFQVGQEMILFDNSGLEFQAILVSLAGRVAEVEILKSRQGKSIANREVFLFLSLAKRDSFEWVLEKGTELGVAAFMPIVSERSEKKEINFARSKNLLKEASEQSGRSLVPEIFEPVSFVKAIETAKGFNDTVVFALDPTGDSFVFKNNLDKSKDRVVIFIGPEGGFSLAEIGILKENGIPIYSLGTQILRAETAAISIASILLLDF